MDDGEEYLAADFSAVEKLNRSLPKTATRLDACYTDAVELMASLDTLSHEVAGALDKTLELIEKSEKRLPNEKELLENDSAAFEAMQQTTGEKLVATLQPTLDSPVLAEMTRLDAIVQRVNQVFQVLYNAKNIDADALSNEVSQLIENGDITGAERLVRETEAAAAVYKDTAEEQNKTRIAAALRQRLPASSSSSTNTGRLFSKLQLL